LRPDEVFVSSIVIKEGGGIEAVAAMELESI
jgi:hypothetical protein